VRRALVRWARFNAVGIMGAALQVAALSLLVTLGMHYLVATALAVEAAVLHNYVWHRRWTWVGRPLEGALWRFHLANGLVSITSNLALMRLFTGHFGVPATRANVLAIAITSVVNFTLGERWVFSQRSSQRTARSVDSILFFKDSRGSEEIMGRRAQPRPVGISRVKEMARHSKYTPSGRCSITQ